MLECLTEFNFPEASTTDRQGLASAGYQVVWKTTPPSGFIDISGNNGRTLKIIPSVDDQDQTFEYEVQINGENGTGPSTTSLEFTVSKSVITPQNRTRMISETAPIIGPVADDSHLYIVTQSDDGVFIDKFNQEEIQTASDGSFLQFSRWIIPTGITSFNDMVLQDNVIYLGGDFGILAYDTDFAETVTLDLPNYSTGEPIDQMLTIGNTLFTLKTEGSTQNFKYANEELSLFFEPNTSMNVILLMVNSQWERSMTNIYILLAMAYISAYTVNDQYQLLLVDEILTSHYTFSVLPQNIPGNNNPITLVGQNRRVCSV